MIVLAAGCGLVSQPTPPRPDSPQRLEPSGPRVTRVFVADEAGNRVLAVDPGTMQVVGQYPVERRPGALLVSADGRRIYVGHHEAKVLLALDTSTGRETS